MKTTDINDQGVVTRKNLGQYHVQVNGQTVLCTLSSHLYRQAIDPTCYPVNQPQAMPAVRSTEVQDLVAIGDQVQVVRTGDGSGLILEILPRRNQFSRPATRPGIYKTEQVIAANVDLIVPVFATTRPTPKWRLLDRYLVAAEASGFESLICITKLDLAGSNPELQTALDVYRQIGYPVIEVCALTGEGLSELRLALKNRISVLVGKSGVGKSSLLNALQPELGLGVQEISRNNKGKHTTTYREMFPLDFGGVLVDTPGIREFGLWDLYAEELADCFPEMRPFLGQCKFRSDCRHDEEPACAIRNAVMAGKISPQRYQSYMRLLEELP